MYRIAVRSAARPAMRNLRAGSKRFASTASPADQPRTWKSSALRWGVAGAALYYYNTSSVFADEVVSQTIDAPPPFANEDLPTVDSVIEEKRKQLQAKKQSPEPASEPAAAADASNTSQALPVEGGAGALQEEAGQQGAFNPETGEINWDCPCLGGMAHGPCGEEFRTAFSCFVYSDQEPKGMDCIEKFQGMQTCFRQYPEIYGAELTDDAPEGNEQSTLEYQKTQTETAPVAAGSEGKVETSVSEAKPAEISSEAAPSVATPSVATPSDATDAKVEAKQE